MEALRSSLLLDRTRPHAHERDDVEMDVRQHSRSRNRSAREQTLEQRVEEEDVAGCKRTARDGANKTACLFL